MRAKYIVTQIKCIVTRQNGDSQNLNKRLLKTLRLHCVYINKIQSPYHSDPTVELARQYDAFSLSVGATLWQPEPGRMFQLVAYSSTMLNSEEENYSRI